jgi:hypothetical protein
VFHEQRNPHPDRARRGWPGRLGSHLRFANVAAGLALFIALGGTAAAAATLDRDSVGSPQIRTDAVRSPEIQADAVRSPEIVSGAVRSSEIRDGGVNIADISTGAQANLRSELRFAEESNDAGDPVPECATQELTDCADYLALELDSGTAPGTTVIPGAGGRTAPQPGTQIPVNEPDRNWLVQATLEVAVNNGVGLQGAKCGLVNKLATGPAAVLDELHLLVQPNQSELESIALSAVVKKRAGNPTIALRCETSGDGEVIVDDARITAVEVGTVTGP